MQTLACKQTSIIYLPGILTVLGLNEDRDTPMSSVRLILEDIATTRPGTWKAHGPAGDVAAARRLEP